WWSTQAASRPPRPLIKGSVVLSNDAPPPSLANATSSTATRPSIFDAAGSARGVRNANRGSVADVDDMGPQAYPTSGPAASVGDLAEEPVRRAGSTGIAHVHTLRSRTFSRSSRSGGEPRRAAERSAAHGETSRSNVDPAPLSADESSQIAARLRLTPSERLRYL